MPKKKKTLKQKMQADQRRDVTTSPQTFPRPITQAEHTPSGVSFSLPSSHAKRHVAPHVHVQTAAVAIDTNEYSYLSKDLLKTLSLSLLIVIAELAIKFFFERG